MDAAIKINGLTKRYDGFTLDGVSFEVPSGSIVGFIGENGAGKTTTIKLILNLIHADEGTVDVFGMNHASDERAIKARLGAVLSESGFHELITVRGVSGIMRGIYKNWDDARFMQLVQKLSLPQKKAFKEFSSGMKMKLAIAVALSHDPDLLVLDEATSGLDPVVRNELLDMLLEFVQDENHSVLFSSHITSDLERVCDYIAFLHRGKLQFCRAKDELLEEFGIMKCGKDEFAAVDAADYRGVRKSSFGCEMLVENRAEAARKYPSFAIDPVTLEDIMVFYAKGHEGGAF